MAWLEPKLGEHAAFCYYYRMVAPPGTNLNGNIAVTRLAGKPIQRCLIAGWLRSTGIYLAVIYVGRATWGPICNCKHPDWSNLDPAFAPTTKQIQMTTVNTITTQIQMTVVTTITKQIPRTAVTTITKQIQRTASTTEATQIVMTEKITTRQIQSTKHAIREQTRRTFCLPQSH